MLFVGALNPDAGALEDAGTGLGGEELRRVELFPPIVQKDYRYHTINTKMRITRRSALQYLRDIL